MFIVCVLVPLWLFFPVYPGWVLGYFSNFDNPIENLLEIFGVCPSASARKSSNLSRNEIIMGNTSKRRRKLFDEKIMIQQKAEGLNRGASWWKKSRYRSIIFTAVAFGIALAVGLSLVFAKENERKTEQRRLVTEIAAGAADSLWQL